MSNFALTKISLSQSSTLVAKFSLICKLDLSLSAMTIEFWKNFVLPLDFCDKNILRGTSVNNYDVSCLSVCKSRQNKMTLKKENII